ncbi:hypothetical protein D5S17_29495 [Pseudonocardiaceae bacterium YIM PH 21723]|nr:hypothetical protein D5S17_29495 [Pseudonocardiaceae bacterium YIM PH 21723]
MLYADNGELEISGDRAELGELAGVLSRGYGELQGEAVDDLKPYDRSLGLVRVVVREREGVSLEVLEDEETLLIAGTREGLAILGKNVKGLSVSGGQGEHLHIEYFPGHFYLTEDSLPVVVTLVD